MNQKRTKVIVTVALALVFSGCSLLTPYDPELQQGNFIKDEQLRQLEPGMTTEQVHFLLGTPMLTGESPQDRWIYPIHEQDGQYRQLIVEFSNGTVTRILRLDNTEQG